MKFQTKIEWQNYLLENITSSYGGYAVVRQNGKNELLYFAKHTYEGEPWLLEAPNMLRRYKINNTEDRDSYIEHGFQILDDYAYDIDSPQCAPFLPEELEIIEVIGSSEGKALDYLLKYDYKDANWKS